MRVSTENQAAKIAKNLSIEEKKIVEKVKKDLVSIDKDIINIQIRVKQIPEYNQKDYLNMMKLLSQFRRDRDSLYSLYHSITTDINYKNKLVAAKALEAETMIKAILEKDEKLSGFKEDFIAFFDAMRDIEEEVDIEDEKQEKE